MKRPSAKRCFLMLAAFAICFLIIWFAILNFFSDNISCHQNDAAAIIRDTCQNSSLDGNGNFCDELCSGKNLFEIHGCFKHHEATLIIKIKWRDRIIILKRKSKENVSGNDKVVESHPLRQKWNEEMVKNYISIKVQEHIGMVFSDKQHNNIINDIRHRKILKYSKINKENDLIIFEQKEFVFLAAFRNLTHIPRLLGACRSMYAVEHATPLSDMFPNFSASKVNYNLRLKIAIGLLDLLAEFRTTELGQLNICNVKKSDFGVTKEDKVVIIDNDMIFTKTILDDFMSQPKCKMDQDCDFFDCKSKCDMKIGKCTKQMKTNNLQLLCQKIFQPTWFKRGILHGLKDELAHELQPLIDKCKSDDFGHLETEHQEFVKLHMEMYLALSRMIPPNYARDNNVDLVL